MFGVLPNALFTSHRGETGRVFSPRLWSYAVRSQLTPDGIDPGYFGGDDFRSFGLTAAVASNVGRYVGDNAGAYVSYEDTGGTITQIATNRNGVMSLTTDADDNQENSIQTGGGTGGCLLISDTAGSDKLLVFEARFAVPQIVTQNLLIGLGEEGFAAADAISDAGAIADKDFIGFQVTEGAAATLTFTYKKNGQTQQTPITALQTLVADTFYNVGFVYDPSEPTARRIKVFLNNTEQSTYVTGTNIAAATFPDGEELAPVAVVKNVSDITILSLDSWAWYQAG